MTISLVTGRTVGIGAYLVRLGQRCIQKKTPPIILTGFNALNKLMGRQVYSSNTQVRSSASGKHLIDGRCLDRRKIGKEGTGKTDSIVPFLHCRCHFELLSLSWSEVALLCALRMEAVHHLTAWSTMTRNDLGGVRTSCKTWPI